MGKIIRKIKNNRFVRGAYMMYNHRSDKVVVNLDTMPKTL